MNNSILVTGGAGFIGSYFVLDWIAHEGCTVINVDNLTYAGNLENLKSLQANSQHIFARMDICDRDNIRLLLKEYQPSAIIHFAAESHVDRSIIGPKAFMDTNITGTFSLLEEAKDYWTGLIKTDQQKFRFLHVSTDEVYGSLGPNDPAFTELVPFAPNSPYSASKAASDHLVRAYFHTYGLPTLTTNCSNNYGPYQFPEKLIPLVILNAIEGKPLPIYGDGQNIRDWLYVGDHCSAIRAVLKAGQPGDTYNIGGKNEKSNLDVVQAICSILDELHPASAPTGGHTNLLQFVKDRPGHDRRYAINPAKIEREIGWKPSETFASGIRKTIEWYLTNEAWIQSVRSGSYRQWMEAHYGGEALV